MFRTCFYPLILSLIVSIVRLKRRLVSRGNIVILCYHRVRNETGIFYDQNISASPEEFKKQISYIKERFNVISLDQLLDYCSGKSDLKPNSIMITFDDGYKDNALNAFPVLENLGIPAIVFPATGLIDSDLIPWEDQLSYLFHRLTEDEIIINNNESYPLHSHEEKEHSIWQFSKNVKLLSPDKRDEIMEGLFDRYEIDKYEMQETAHSMSMRYMTTDDIRYWKDHGVDFGVHTVSHPRITALNEKEIYKEISESKKTLEAILEKPVNAFAYPYGKEGDFNEVTRSALKRAGIAIGMIFEPGINRPDTDFLELYRIGIAGNMDFRLACHGFSSYWDILKEIRRYQ